jgi:catechol 2,3-dioxygenase
MNELPFAATTPVSVARVGLKARNAEALADYYRAVVGLAELSRTNGTISLGAGDRPLLFIESDPSARPDDPRSAGLFHTAFLLPARADLARWVKHAIEKRIPIDGASDHLVSEALYLTDPEGNGIEIYADRPKEKWARSGGGIEMATAKLDMAGLVAEIPAGDAGWRGIPDNSIIGHVHLRVGDPETAERWWHAQFDFDTMAKYGADAVFLASGGYHHHIGANAWRSRGAGPRDDGRTGLAWVEMQSSLAEKTEERRDPWGTLIRTVPKKIFA